MIPPSQDVRLRSIRRWMQDQQPQNFHRWNQSGELEDRLLDVDQMMLETFDSQEDALMAELMRKKTWGTQDGMREFNTQRLMAWQDVVAEYLPTTAPA